MSLEAVATIICDNCGKRSVSTPYARFTECGWFAGKHKRELTEAGWMIASRGRFYPEAHYCPDCADKPVKPLKGNPRWKGPEITPAITEALQPVCLMPEDKTVWVMIGSPCLFVSNEGGRVQWSIRHRSKTFQKEEFSGWIDNASLKEILGFQPKT